MVKRLTDVILAAGGLVLAVPFLIIGSVGILLSSPGPVFYKAHRAGRFGTPFRMLKLRTMHLVPSNSPRITAHGDDRIFAFGRLLRILKIDELPQLVNVLRGEMSIVGPRPEDPDFVTRYFDETGHETLSVRPGLTSPGALYNYTHGERMLQGDDVEDLYLRTLLPVKLALDVIYVRQAGFWYDVRVIARTIWSILGSAVGRREFAEPPEFAAAVQLVNNSPPVKLTVV